MADPDLVHRAEQAYLGALLARQGQAATVRYIYGDAGPGGFSGLHPQDFTGPVHQAVYAGLASQALPARTGLAAVYERLIAVLTRLLSPRARHAAGYMAGLPGLCPDPGNLAAYAAMVTEASRARAVPAPGGAEPAPAPQRPAAGNQRLASAARWLDATSAGRHQALARQTDPAYTAAPSQPRRTPDGLDRRTARLARVLGADVRRLAGRAAPPAAPSPLPAGNQAAPLTAGALQEQLLADLMLHPASAGDVTSWLPATVFDAGHNRILYQLIRRRQDNGRPVDPLIIAWDASTLIGGSGSAAAHGESMTAAALRLGTLNPAPGTAVILARPLHAEHLRAGGSGPDWDREHGTVPGPIPAAASAARPAQAAAPAQTGREPAAALRPHPAAVATSKVEPVPAGRPVPASPRHASGLPLRRPPLPSPAEPGPVPRA